MRLSSRLGLALLTILALCYPAPAMALEIFASGIPTFMGKNPDWDAVFSQLSKAGIHTFLPDSQYIQVPEAKSLGWEVDFLAPRADRSNLVFRAMRRHGIKLLIPAECLYPRSKTFPPLSSDPLRTLIAKVGRDSVAGVFSYDEPVTTDLSFERVKELYRRVKEIDSTLPVYLVHAPIPEAPWKGEKNPAKIADIYLSQVKRFSTLTDFVGFDVYPIPESIAKVTTPDDVSTPTTSYRKAVADYSLWLRKNTPDKKHFMVLQAFSYEDQGFPKWLAILYGARRPTAEELRQMAQVTKDSGIDVLGWWGQGMLGQAESDRAFWQSLLHVSEAASTKDSAGTLFGSYLKAIGGEVGIAVLNPTTKKVFLLNENKPFPMQSVCKLPIAIAILKLIDEGKLSLQDKITVQGRDLDPTHSPIKAAINGDRTQFTLQNLIERAICQSDNTACDILIKTAGGTKEITRILQVAGISDIRIDRPEAILQPESLDIVRYLQDPRDTATPRGMVELLQKLFCGKLLSEESKEVLMQNLLSCNTGKNRLKAGLPAGWKLAHKTGTGGNVAGQNTATNDVGIILNPKNEPIYIAIFIKGSHETLESREAFMAKIAALACSE